MSKFISSKLIGGKYMLAAVIALIVMYGLIYTKQQYHDKPILDGLIQKFSIDVLTDNKQLLLDPNVFEVHIKHMKDTLNILNKTATYTPAIANCINQAKQDTLSYIDANNADAHVRNLIDNTPRNNRIEISNISSSDYEPNYSPIDAETRENLSKLLDDMDVIINMTKLPYKKRGRMKLDAINNLNRQLYKANRVNYETMRINELLTGIDAKYNQLLQDMKDAYSKPCDGRNNNGYCYTPLNARLLDGSQNTNVITGDFEMDMKESFVMPKNKSMYKNQMLSTHHSPDNPYISQKNVTDFKSTDILTIPTRAIKDNFGFQGVDSKFDSQIDRTSRTSLL